MQPGSGKIDINRLTLEEYFGRETSRMVFRQPLELTETSGRFDVFVLNVSGGRKTLSGQLSRRHPPRAASLARDISTKVDPQRIAAR